MPTIIYLEHNGTRHEVEVAVGMSVMEGAVSQGIPGIVAECGGSCSCATCHCYVDEAWLDRVGEPEAMEAAMLPFALEPRDNSRLSCQLEVTEELDCLVVRLPAAQC